MAKFRISVDFYSMEFTVSAKNKRDARKKAKPRIAKKVNAHINHLYIDKED